MLAKSKKKIAYWFFAIAAVAMLLGTPALPIPTAPAVYADCSNPSGGNCGG